MVLVRRMQGLQTSVLSAGRQAAGLAAGLHAAPGLSPGRTAPTPRGRTWRKAWRELGDPALVSAGLLAADVVAGGAAFVVSFVVARGRPSDIDGLLALMPFLGVILAGVLLYLASRAQYDRRLSLWTEARVVAGAACCGLLATALVAYLMLNERARLPVLAGWAIFPPSVLLARSAVRRMLNAAGRWRIPVIVVGDAGRAAEAVASLVAAPHLGYDVTTQIAPDRLPLLLTPGGWRGLLRQHGARIIMLAYDASDPDRPSSHMIEALVREQVPVAMMRTTHGLPALGCEQTWFVGHEAMMLTYATARSKPVSRMVKAGLDVAAAAAALLVLLPVFLIIAALIRRDGGPALFGHTRIGQGGLQFSCLKFRTMVTDGDAVLDRVLACDPYAAAEWAATQKLRHDPRVTWIGRILRKTSLDELPQLINVLRLEMSLVGPRPIVSREIGRYADDIAYYYETRPGITGLWQVSGRNDTSYARRVELDRWYVKNWTLWQDFSILARTLPAVLSGRGAS